MPGKLRFGVALAGAMHVLAACGEPIQPTTAAPVQIMAHMVLDLGATSHRLLLERTERDANGSVAIRNARVSLLTPAGIAVTLFEQRGQPGDAAGPAVYIITSSGIQNGLIPGGTYGLRIVTVGDDTVTGTTKIPTATPVSSPGLISSFNRQTDTLRLSWRRVPGAKSYQVSVYSEANNPEGQQRFHYSVFADTAIAIAGTMRTIDNEPVFPVGTRVRVVAVAVEDNYYTYYHAPVDPFAGAPPGRLTGALGVFGAVVPVVNRLYDVR